MNLIITTTCNKNCSFCFAHEYNQMEKHMSIETLEKLIPLLQRSGYKQVKLLGGEPTQHPQFREFTETLEKNNINYTLISNLLVDNPETIATITKAIKDKKLQNILANASELSGETESVFIKNYMVFAKLVREIDEFSLSCSITLSRNKTISEETNYLSTLIKKIPIFRLRLSFDFQGGNQEDTQFINNYTYGEKIKQIMAIAGASNIPLSWDCKFYPCVFEDKLFAKKIIGEIVKTIHFNCKDSLPLDVFPDLHYIHCYPCSTLKGTNILDFPTIQAVIADLLFRKRIINYEKNIPETCRSCIFLKQNKCDSLCLGCSKINSPLAIVPAKKA